MAIDWTVGEVSAFANSALAAVFSFYAIGIAYNAGRALVNRLDDRWSSVAATVLASGLAGLWWRAGATILPAPFSLALLAIFLIALIFTFTYTVGRYQERIAHFQAVAGKRLNHLLEDIVPARRLEIILLWRKRLQLRPDRELVRKTPHMMMGVFVFIYLGIGHLVLAGLAKLLVYDQASGREVASNLLQSVSHDMAPWLMAGHVFALILLLGLYLFMAPTEFLRLRYPELSYPFKQTILRSLRKKEEGLFGAHLYIVISLPLSIIFLTWDESTWNVSLPAVIAMLAVTVFADSASALFGRRFGRTPLPHNSGKTYVGSFAGTATAFLVTIPFVGLPMAAVTAAVFLSMDLLAPIPIPVTDNILNPVALSIAYWYGINWLNPMLPFY